MENNYEKNCICNMRGNNAYIFNVRLCGRSVNR